MGKKRKKSSSSSEVENCCGEVASDVRIIHADTYTICHTCILYTTRARIDTHTHILFFLWWAWCQHISCNSWFTLLYALGSPNPRKPRRRSKRRLPHQSLRRLEATQNCLQVLHRVYLLACFITSYFCLFGGICHGFANVFLKYIAVRYCKHLSFQEPGSKNQQVVFLVHFWKMYHVLPDLELFDNSHSLGSIQ